MRSLALSLLLVTSAAGAQPAESVDELETRGQALARDGKYVEAIATFRAAERTEPRAIHDCLIGLAYLRMGALTEADITFGDCNRRAGSPAALPAWVAKEQAASAEQLAQSSLGTITVAADAAITTLVIPGVLDGQPFAARTLLRLTPGAYEITGRASDGRTVTRALTVMSKGASSVTLTLAPTTGDPGASPGETKERRSHTGPLALTVAGGTFVLAGAASHLFWAHPARVDADKATDMDTYDRALDRFKTARAVTIASYAVGGVALIAGLVWWKHSSAERDAPRISLYITHDSGGVVMQWRH